MFKALDIWMAELEEEYYDAYMKAHSALKDWKTSKRAMVRDIEVWDIRDQLKSNYQGYCSLYVSDRFKETVFTSRGIEWAALIDVVTIGGAEYNIVIAIAKTKGQEDTPVSWSIESAVEKGYKEQLSRNSGWEKFLYDRKVYSADIKLVEGRDEPWIRTRAHKDMIQHKEALEAKITKICDKIDSVDEDLGEYYVKGTNGKVARVWRIIAGGWNIQRAHTRVLCKEVKNI